MPDPVREGQPAQGGSASRLGRGIGSGAERIKLALLLLLFLAAAAGVWQAKRLADATGQLLREAPDRSQQAVAAFQSATAAGTRAWVGPKSAKVHGSVVSGAPVVVELALRNAGREPAVNLSWNMRRFVSANSEASAKDLGAQIDAYVKQCVATPPKAGQATLFPMPDTGSSFALATTFEGKVIDNDVVSGKKLLFIETCLAYATASRPAHSAFCYFYSAQFSDPQNLNLCEIGNYAD